MNYEVLNIFTPTKTARQNYIVRENLVSQVMKGLLIPGLQLILIGENGNGKSTILENEIDKIYETTIKITCTKTQSFEDLLIQAFDDLNLYYTKSKDEVNGNKKRIQLGFSKIFSAKARVEKTKNDKIREERIIPFQLTVHNLIDSLNKINSCLILEDIHRLEESELGKVMSNMKIFADMGKENVKLICTTKEHKPLFDRYGDLYNRLTYIEIPAFDDSSLERIITNGSELLNISFSRDFINQIISESKGKPNYIHRECLTELMNSQIFQTQKEKIEISSSA